MCARARRILFSHVHSGSLLTVSFRGWMCCIMAGLGLEWDGGSRVLETRLLLFPWLDVVLARK